MNNFGATDPLLEEGSTVASEHDTEILDLVAPDVIIVLRNPQRPDSKDSQEIINVEELLDQVLVNPDTSAETFPKMTSLAKEAPRCDFEQAVLEDLCGFCAEAGFSIAPFLSADRDEIFLRISVMNEEVAGIYAERYTYRLQTTPELVERLGIKQPLEEIHPAYMSFSRKQNARFQQNDGKNLYKRYWENGRGGANGSIFRIVDRVRIIYRTLCDELDLDDLLKFGIVKAHYAVHTRAELDGFKSWASLQLCDACFQQPLTKIRNYFGERQGFYFAWAGHSSVALVPLAVLASVLAGLRGIQRFAHTIDIQQDVVDAWLFGVSGVALVAWVALYLKYWTRAETRYQQEWDCSGAEDFPELQPARPDFVGTPTPAFYDARVKTRQYSQRKILMWKMFAWTVTILFIIALVAAVVFVFSLQTFFDKELGTSYGSIAVSITMAVQIKIFGFVWNKVAPWLVDLENPRTSSQHASSLIWKLFLFQFINCYYSFFYIAFVQQYRGGCKDDDCLAYLRHSLHTTFGSLAVISLIELAIPYAQFKWAQRAEDRKLRQTMVEGESELPKRSFMEDQAKRAPYDSNALISDMLEKVLQLGYVMLFGNVAPGIIVVCLALFTAQLRADAWKLCHSFQRPRPVLEGSLGAANDILKFLAKLSPYSLIALPVFNLDLFEPLGFRWKIILFLAVKELLDMMRHCIDWASDDLPEGARKMQIQRQYVMTKFTQHSRKAEVSVQAAPVASVKSLELQTLNQHSGIWHHCDSCDHIRTVPSSEDRSGAKQA